MSRKFRILSCAAECAPFAKAGGLADVVAALAKTFAARGRDVKVVMPLYRRLIKGVDWNACEWTPLAGPLRRWSWSGGDVYLARHRPQGPDGPEICFVEHPGFYERDGIYGDSKGGFGDNEWRFALLAAACAALPEALDWAPDIYHVHDWHAGLVPPLLRRHRAAKGRPDLERARIVMNIHNLAHRGVSPAASIERAGLPAGTCRAETGEFHGHFSFLKAGLAYSDAIATVSPNYARETLTREGGEGMEGFLRSRAGRYAGILNGIDEQEWNPATDPRLPARYSAADLSGKAECKRRLQEERGLHQRADVPLLGMVSRLDAQKGHDLLLEILPGLMKLDVQLVALGSGSPRLAESLKAAQARWPGRVSAAIGYDEGLSHRIEAGSDLFLMPSRFEPCGLNQLYSMRYGTVPVVRRVGGLRDSVDPWTYERDGRGGPVQATGFGFEEFSPAAFLGTLGLAVKIYRSRPGDFRQMRLNGMAQRLGWGDRILEYEGLFERVLQLPAMADRLP
jgi:starch synthase